MIFTAAELADSLVRDLPTEVRKVVEAHFFDGESLFKIQRRVNLNCRDVSKIIEDALVTMRSGMLRRGVLTVNDVI